MTVNSFKRRGSRLLLNKVEYVGFLIGNLPTRFAYIYEAKNETNGITSWFNYLGWTFIKKSDM